MKTILIANQKGGVGKTTTTSALSSGLKRRGFRTLAIDLDPQSNLTASLGIEGDNYPTLDDILSKRMKIRDVLIKDLPVGDLIPASLSLSDADRRFTQYGAHRLLRNVLQEVAEDYDYVILDAPPSLGIISVNAMVAADYVIVPVNTAAFSLQGIQSLWRIIEEVKADNRNLSVAGILVTCYSKRTLISRDVISFLEELTESLGTKVFDTKIRQAIAIVVSQVEKKDIFSYAPGSGVSEDYSAFCDELLKLMENK